jgi:hypothetical protein
VKKPPRAPLPEASREPYRMGHVPSNNILIHEMQDPRQSDREQYQQEN